MSKYPPATDATPEALARALVRREPSSHEVESGRTQRGARPSAQRSAADRGTPVDRSGSSSAESPAPTDREQKLEQLLESWMPPEIRREFLKSLHRLDREDTT